MTYVSTSMTPGVAFPPMNSLIDLEIAEHEINMGQLTTDTPIFVVSPDRIILPIIRRVMPTVIANDIVGVQPMTGPIGQIYSMRSRYADV